jgi:adenylate cyclase
MPTTQVAATAPKEIPEKSVAVLAFADLSEKHDQDFFSDGLAEELRDLLAQVPDLKVAARTSSFYFKTHAATIPEIAKSLGVQHLLEGSVRKAGNSIRVTVQLIRADTGFNLWSSTFDRETSDVFKVQDEIANAVVRALQTRLLPSAAPLGARQTSSPEAHDLYLLGRRRYHAGTVESDREAVALFRQATLADPTYAAAFAALSLAEGNLMIDLGRIETAGEYRERIAHAEHAVVLGPQIADGYAVRGITRLGNGEWAAARQDLERAAQLDPNDSQNLRFLARYYASQGELARAIDMVSRAIATDPGDSYARVWRAHFELSDGQNQAARIDLERALQLSPANRKAQGLLAYLDSVEGDPEAALQLAHALPSEAMRIPLESAARCARGDRTSANATFDRWVAGARDMGLAYTVAAYAVCGQIDKALGALEHDIAQPTHLLGETLETIRYHPFFKRLHDQPRYLALIRKVQLSN